MRVGLVRVAEDDVAHSDGVGDGPRDLAQVAVIVDRLGPLDPAGAEPGDQRRRQRAGGEPTTAVPRRAPATGRP